MNTMKRLGLMGACLLLMGGCARHSANTGESATTVSGAALHIAPGGYTAAFDQSRDVLRDLGFILDRVDAQLGVISTQPKGTGGIATPWDQEQSGLGDKLEDAVQRHRRVVRIEFAPAGADPGAVENGGGPGDLRAAKDPIDARISVTVYRVNQPGWRLNTQAILDSTYTHDPQLDERGMALYSVAIRQDDDLARRIAQRIHERLEGQAAAR